MESQYLEYLEVVLIEVQACHQTSTTTVPVVGHVGRRAPRKIAHHSTAAPQMAERDTDTAKALLAEEQARVVNERESQAAAADAAAAEERRESIAAAAEAIEGEQARRVGEMAERDAAFAAEEAEERTAATATAIELTEKARAEAIAASAKADADAAAERCVRARLALHSSLRARLLSPCDRCSAGCCARTHRVGRTHCRMHHSTPAAALYCTSHLTRVRPDLPSAKSLPHTFIHERTRSVVNAAKADKAVEVERVRRTSLTGPAPTPPKELLSEIAAKAAAK